MENSVNNANQFYFFKDSKETRTMYTKSRNIKIMMGKETDDITEQLRNLFYKIIKKIKKTNERKWVCSW